MPNESRDWRIYFELAQRLITKARALYVDDFGVELANTVYALDATIKPPGDAELKYVKNLWLREISGIGGIAFVGRTRNSRRN
jgi:hypothetical protein